MSHQKHTKLTRPDLGVFARNEWALIGAPCGILQQRAEQLIRALNAEYRVAYVDADHQHGDASPAPLFGNSNMVYTDKVHFHRLDVQLAADTFRYRQWFQDQELVIVNGNHFRARRQIVVIDPRKFESLERKLDRLDGVEGFWLTEAEQTIPEFLRQHIPNWAELPVWGPDQVGPVVDVLRSRMRAALAPVSGLVLAGGRSTRMGKDKGELNYHGKPQREYVYELCSQLGLSAYLSCRPEQVTELGPNMQTLPDTFTGLGPYGAILSAFRHDPNRAWLVVACDLPFVDEAALRHLLDNRRTSAVATAFHNPDTGFPDPLLTLWEPRAYPVLLQFLSQGHSCPRKVLINSDTESIELVQQNWLTNVNTPDEYTVVRAMVKEGK